MLRLFGMQPNFGYMFTHKLTGDFSFAKYVCNNSLRIILKNITRHTYILYSLSQENNIDHFITCHFIVTSENIQSLTILKFILIMRVY